MAIVLQNAGKQGFFVISGRNSGETYEVLTTFYAKQSQLLKSQMNVNPYNTTDYENKSNWTLGENKPNSNPNKANFQKAQMNVNSLITKDYRKNDAFAVQKNKPNSNPNKANLKRAKMDVSIYYTEDYENKWQRRVRKNKPNSNPNKANFKRDDGFSAYYTRDCTALRSSTLRSRYVARVATQHEPRPSRLRRRPSPRRVGPCNDLYKGSQQSKPAIRVAGKPLYEIICKYRVTPDFVKAISFV